MLDVVWLIPALPLAGFVLILLFGRKLGDPKAGYLATLMCGGAFVVTVGVFFDLLSKSAEERQHIDKVFSWVPVGSLKVDLAFLADPLSITMCLFVTGIGTLIHLYAVGYMQGDPRFSKFFLYLNLFAVSMLVLVLGENMLVTFLGWEGVGTCSYLLDLVLARAGQRRDGRQEGVRHQPRRGLGLHDGDVLRLPGHRHVELHRCQRSRPHDGADDRDGHRPVLLHRRVRQERPAAVVPVVARRDGRPDAGVGADPCRHDGHGWRVPDVPHEPASSRPRRRTHRR